MHALFGGLLSERARGGRMLGVPHRRHDGIRRRHVMPTRRVISSAWPGPPAPTHARQKLSKKQVQKLCKKAKKSKKQCKKGDAKDNCKFSKKEGCVPK